HYTNGDLHLPAQPVAAGLQVVDGKCPRALSGKFTLSKMRKASNIVPGNRALSGTGRLQKVPVVVLKLLTRSPDRFGYNSFHSSGVAVDRQLVVGVRPVHQRLSLLPRLPRKHKTRGAVGIGRYLRLLGGSGAAFDPDIE